jgi:hypothetical protein
MDALINRRYQIFISSTFTDLVLERRAAYDAVLSLRHMPVGMEYFPAAHVPPWELIKNLIDDSDYYVLIIAARYGSVNEAGLSFTENEYDYAVKTGKPVLAFVHGSPSELPRGKTDGSDEAWQKLEKFRRRVLSNTTCSLWVSAEDLKSKLVVSLVTTMREKPGRGWVRPTTVNDDGKDALSLKMLRDTRAVSDVIESSIIRRIGEHQPLSDQIPTGIDELDTVIGGFTPSSIVVAGARPGTGLSTVLTNIVLGTAKQDLPVLVFTTEKNVDDYTQRLISCLAGIKLTAVDIGISSDEFSRLSAALIEISNRNIYLDGNCSHTFDTFVARCREQKARCGALPLIVLDSLQFIGFDNDPRLGIPLKRLAIELGSTIIIGTKLNRNVDLRPNKRPLLSDVTHHDIADVADIALFVFRPSIFDNEASSNTLEIVVAKNSNGPISAVKVACNFTTGEIFSAPRQKQEDSNDF